MALINEADLIAAAQRGKLDAFNELVLSYQNRVYNLACRIMNDPSSASDATQEAFVSAYRNIKRYRGGSFKAWLMRIVSNACYDELRRRKRRPTTSFDDFGELDEEANPALISHLEGPADYTERRELADALQSAIGTLPPDQRITLVLSDVEDCSYQEIADITNVSLGTVKSRLSRARTKLRDYLQAERELLPSRYRL